MIRDIGFIMRNEIKIWLVCDNQREQTLLLVKKIPYVYTDVGGN